MITTNSSTQQPRNQIWYTSSDGNVVTPNATDVFGANIVSNTYENDRGVIKFDEDVTTIGNFVFRNCNSLTSITIPNSVTSIGNYAFAGCSSLTSINIPDSVTTIGNYIFSWCIGLTSVTISDSVTSIRSNSFYECTSLTSVTIPDSIILIYSSAFAYCSSLTSITIPDGVTNIGSSVFSYCTSLKTVYCKATIPPKLNSASVFVDNSYGRKIYVPYQSLNAYKTAQYWSEYADDIIGYDFENDTVKIFFPITIMIGDNGKLGIELYNYLIAVLPENTMVSCPNDEYGIGEIIIQGYGNVERLGMMITPTAKNIIMMSSKLSEVEATPSLRNTGILL